jgi:hypothetical protein
MQIKHGKSQKIMSSFMFQMTLTEMVHAKTTTRVQQSITITFSCEMSCPCNLKMQGDSRPLDCQCASESYVIVYAYQCMV